MRKFRVAAILAVASMMAVAPQADAAVFGFTLSGSGFSASGTITADSTPIANPWPCPTCAVTGYDVTAITGTINGQAITGLASVNSVFGNDNRIYDLAPYLDWGDLGFTTATDTYNVFHGDYGSHPGYLLAVLGQGPFDNPVTFTLTSAAAVPEPATWVMLLLGFGMVGCALRQRAAAPRQDANIVQA